MYKPFSILVVDDEVMIAQDLKESLEAVGYQSVFRSGSYIDALAILKLNSIDLVMIDINLNNKFSGLDLARYINKNHQIPFIYLTSYSDTETIESVKHTKPNGFLLKPYDETLLLTTIEIALFNNYHNKQEITEGIDSVFQDEESYEFFVDDYLIFKDKRYFIKIQLNEILWFESDKNYIDVKTIDRKYTIRSSLKKVMENLPDTFLKCHRQYVINLDYVTGFNSNFVSMDEYTIPISRNEQEIVLKRLTF